MARLPATPGVYRFRDARGRALYVGRASQLRRRVASYWGDLRGRRHLGRMVARIVRVEAVACESEHEAAWLERNLLERSMPPWNRTAGGQEVPVYLRLDARPGGPGLTVAHAGPVTASAAAASAPTGGDRDVRCFGPYLGGDRVRLAVTGLHRVLPLAYAGTGLTGSARDMAATLGVRPGDRERLVATLAAVLGREPDAVAAVRAELAARRERAAGALAFELAGRLHAELDAVDWLTSPQRVTLGSAADAADAREATVHGWAGGVLVRFEIRAGRLDSWTQRACKEAAARPHLAASPAGWADFAHRNAELAAALLA